MSRIKLGKEYRDSITGFRGVAVGRYEYLYGCVRIGLEGVDKDGKPEELTFDEQRLESPTGSKPQLTATAGGPKRTPPRSGH